MQACTRFFFWCGRFMLANLLSSALFLVAYWILSRVKTALQVDASFLPFLRLVIIFYAAFSFLSPICCSPCKSIYCVLDGIQYLKLYFSPARSSNRYSKLLCMYETCADLNWVYLLATGGGELCLLLWKKVGWMVHCPRRFDTSSAQESSDLTWHQCHTVREAFILLATRAEQ